MTSRTTVKQIEAAKRVFRRHGGVMRTGEATTQGVHCRTLYAMRDAGILERLDRVQRPAVPTRPEMVFPLA